MAVHQALTRNQNLVLKALDSAEGPLGAYTILDMLRGEGFRAPLQVYRALDKLLELGLVHRLESLNAFVACAHPDCNAHATIAFAICERCGKVAEFSDPNVEQSLGAWVTDNHFKPTRSIIEIRGECGACILLPAEGASSDQA